MPLTVNTNTLSLNAQRNLGKNTALLAKSMEKLSSGYRINRAGDDAAGLQLSEGLRTQIRGSKKALDNVLDGINVLNIVDGAYQTIEDNLQRMRELAVQAANDTYSVAQRDAIQVEIFALYQDNERIARSTEFNGVALLSDVGVPANFWLQVGANDVAGIDSIDIAAALGDATNITGLNLLAADIDVDTHLDAQNTIGNLDSVMTQINIRRGNLGAFVNRLEGAASNLMIGIENLMASESRIRNVDVASESATLTQNQILQQSAAIVLSQANQTPALALQLLKGQ